MTRTRPRDQKERMFWIELGFRVSVARDQCGVSQAALARQVGLSRATIANIEGGRNRTGLWELRCMAEALGVRLSKLIPKGVL